MQWNWPDTFGEILFVAMLGALYTHRWLLVRQQETDCKVVVGHRHLFKQSQQQAQLADSFLYSAHVSRTRQAYQVIAAALHILQYHAYSRFKERVNARDEEVLHFEEFYDVRAAACPQF